MFSAGLPPQYSLAICVESNHEQYDECEKVMCLVWGGAGWGGWRAEVAAGAGGAAPHLGGVPSTSNLGDQGLANTAPPELDHVFLREA